MEKYCISLEQAKRLFELNFLRDSEFKYFDGVLNSWMEEQNTKPETIIYPAYHVGELGEFLPSEIKESSLEINKTSTGWWVSYNDITEYGGGYLVQPQFGYTEAQARGALLIYLLENNIL